MAASAAPEDEGWRTPRESLSGQPSSPAKAQGSSSGRVPGPGPKDNAEARAAATAVLCGPKDEVLSFGKHRGRTYQDALDTDKEYVRWVLSHCNENSSQDLCRFKDWLLAKAEAEKEGSAVG